MESNSLILSIYFINTLILKLNILSIKRHRSFIHFILVRLTLHNDQNQHVFTFFVLFQGDRTSWEYHTVTVTRVIGYGFGMYLKYYFLDFFGLKIRVNVDEAINYRFSMKITFQIPFQNNESFFP